MLNLNNNSGLAFSNDRATSDKAPQFKGEILIDGKRVEVAVWERTTKAGKKMLCFSVEDVVAKELQRHESMMEKLANKSEAPEPRDELAQKPDETEKAVPTKARRKVA